MQGDIGPGISLQILASPWMLLIIEGGELVVRK